jgi:rSAM/selenodomain-associated transferase 1
MSELLAVFARAPELGRVKTRLCPPLTNEQALELHMALVADSLDHFGRVERPELEHGLFLSQPLLDPQDLTVPEAWTVSIQVDGDLGRRLASLFYSAFQRDVARLVVLGSDSPTLPLEVIHEAFDELGRRKVVVGPAEDGGFYLLGASAWLPELFQNIQWGTAEVLSQTTAVLARQKLDFTTLIPWYDVDRGKDLDKLRQEIDYLKRAAPDLVPVRVAAVLTSSEAPEYTFDRDF